MEILVAILVIVVIAGTAFALLQRRPVGAGGLGRARREPVIRQGRAVPPGDGMTAAVVDHAQVTDPSEVPAAEARLRVEARQIAAAKQVENNRIERQRAHDLALPPRAAYADPADLGDYADPAPAPGTSQHGYAEPPSDPRYDPRP